MTAMRIGKVCKPIVAALLTLPWLAGVASAASPVPWQMDLQPAASPVMAEFRDFHDLLLVVITLIAIFVSGLLAYTMWRFSAKRNPVPTRTTHNTLVEILWTVVPVLVLVLVAVPSFKLLYFQDVVPKADMTIKTIGHQWYWSYEYPDNGKFDFDALMIPDEEIKPGQIRLLETDNSVVLPVDTTVRIIVTADDVLHSWAVPAFGIKIDAVPGRLNETWVRIDREGTYYGQCSELCGLDHGFMPIRVEAVSKAKFNTWVRRAQKKFARDGEPAPEKPVRLEHAAR